MRVLVALLSFSFIPVLRVAVRLLQCDEVEGRRLLRAYPTVECSGAAYSAWATWSWLVSSILFFGGCGLVLYGQRVYRALFVPAAGSAAPAVSRSAEKFVYQRFGFLLRSYSPLSRATASWECVYLSRAALVAVAATLVDDRQTRFALLALISFLASAAHAAVHPFAHDRENSLETLALAAAAVVGMLNSTEWGTGAFVFGVTAVIFYGVLATGAAAVVVPLLRADGALGRLRSSVTKAGRQSMPRVSRASAAAAASGCCTRLWCWYRSEDRKSTVASASTDAPASIFNGDRDGGGPASEPVARALSGGVGSPSVLEMHVTLSSQSGK